MIWKFEGFTFYTFSYTSFPGGSEIKESACNAGDPGSIPGKIPRRREWPLTPVFLPGDFHGQRSLMSYSLWGCNESDMTERLTHTSSIHNLLHVWCKVRTEFIISYPEHQVQHH